MSGDRELRLLYHSPPTTGGLAAYAHEQAQALAAAGCDVSFVTRRDYEEPRNSRYRVVRLHPPIFVTARALPRIVRRSITLNILLQEQYRLANYIKDQAFKRVLMGSYIEYAAPLWASRFQWLASRGHVFGAVIHDPVRDYIVGPRWWHRVSVASGYSFLREAFIHAPTSLDTGHPMPRLRVTVIPHGPYTYPTARQSRAELRQSLGIPANATVLLAFGHIRDGKNLDLVIEALKHIPDIHLLVAGSTQNDSCRPGQFYQALARERQLAERCHWLLRYISDDEVAGLFDIADFTLLTYSRNFRSASGVLNTALAFRKPCLASSGESNLKDVVQKYGLGVWVEPDSVQAVHAGLQILRDAPPIPRWEDYEREQSWKKNAALVMDNLFSK